MISYNVQLERTLESIAIENQLYIYVELGELKIQQVGIPFSTRESSAEWVLEHS